MVRRPESKAGKMFHLPGNVTVCDECMHKTMDAMSHMDMSSMMSNPDMLNSLNYYNQMLSRMENEQHPKQEKTQAENEQDTVEKLEGDV